MVRFVIMNKFAGLRVPALLVSSYVRILHGSDGEDLGAQSMAHLRLPNIRRFDVPVPVTPNYAVTSP